MLKKLLFIVSCSLFIALASPTWAANDFQNAAALLTAAKNMDIARVQNLINAGADVNFVDSTGLSPVCTALMNNDTRAAQILQMYGADASKCDRQIRNYKGRKPAVESGGFFSGLSDAQSMTLAAVGVAAVVGGILVLSDSLGSSSSNAPSSGGGQCRPNTTCTCANGLIGTCSVNGICENCSTTPGGGGTLAMTIPYGPAYISNGGYSKTIYDENLTLYGAGGTGNFGTDFNYLRPATQPANNYIVDGITAKMQNYLLQMHGYSSFAHGYLGQKTLRNDSHIPLAIPSGSGAGGAMPVLTALITENGVNRTGSAASGEIKWIASANATAASGTVDKYANCSVGDDCATENTIYDLSGHGTVFGDATPDETALAKIIAGWAYNGRATGDLYGFMPNGQLLVYRTGGGLDNTDGVIDIHNWRAMDDAKTRNTDIIANLALNPQSRSVDYLTIDGLRSLGGTRDLYKNYVDNYYDTNSADNSTATEPSGYMDSLFTPTSTQAIVFSAGEFAYGVGAGKSPVILDATFENYAPAVYTNLDHLFMTVVAVQQSGGTASATTVAGYGDGVDNGKFGLTLRYDEGADTMFAGVKGVSGVVSDQDDAVRILLANLWSANATTANINAVADAIHDLGGTATSEDIAAAITAARADDAQYASRKCGIAGVGINGVDPWCFAAAGGSAEMATAAAAGAFGAIQGAFAYMDKKQVFKLMALTSTGGFLKYNDSGTAFTIDTLVDYLQDRYTLPGEYGDVSAMTDAEYLENFANVFGYGLINLERAMNPGHQIFYYDGQTNSIVSGGGNAYWRTASERTVFNLAGAMNLGNASIPVEYYDVLENIDGSLKLPRVFTNEFALGNHSARGLYMGDVLGDFSTRKNEKRKTKNEIGNMLFEMSLSEKSYADNLSGLDNIKFGYSVGNADISAGYQRYFTDGQSRFTGVSNPILSLASNTVATDVKYNYGKFQFGGRAFSGAITDEGLLENDPTISNGYNPAKLGMISGADANITWRNDMFEFTGAVGNARESDTMLGAQTGGLLKLGGADTMYIDAGFKVRPTENMTLALRGTFAQTKTDAIGELIMGISEIQSNAFSAALEFGNFEFAVAAPLAVSNGNMQYAHADFDVVEDADGNYNIVADTHIAALNLAPENREIRFSGSYRHAFGEFTDGALGFIYRVNPNHTRDFGNESIFMFKLSHRLGI